MHISLPHHIILHSKKNITFCMSSPGLSVCMMSKEKASFVSIYIIFLKSELYCVMWMYCETGLIIFFDASSEKLIMSKKDDHATILGDCHWNNKNILYNSYNFIIFFILLYLLIKEECVLNNICRLTIIIITVHLFGKIWKIKFKSPILRHLFLT